MLFEKVRMLFMHCFHHVSSTKKTVEQSWYNYFTFTKKRKVAWITGFTVAWDNSSFKMLAHSWETLPKKFLYPKTTGKGCFSSKLLWNIKLWQSFWVLFHEVFPIPNTISTRKSRDDETNPRTSQVKKCIYRIYITSLDFKIEQKKH